MPQALPPVTMPDMGGGVNTGVKPDLIGDNEFSRLINFIPDGPSIRRRGGTRRITVDPYSSDGASEELTSFHRFKSGPGGLWALIVGAQRSIALLDAGGQNLRVLSAPGQYVDSFVPWVFAQYKEIVYGFRTGPGMQRIQVTPYERVSDPGMSPPATAPSLGLASLGGVIPSADFRGVVTCYNTRTGAESNPSPESATYSHVGPAAITWSNIPLCPPDQANARRLWRTLPNQTGAEYLVDMIADNITTTYAHDNKLVQDLGKAVSFKNGLPPVNLLMGVIWKDRLFVSDGFYVYWSQTLLPESFWENDSLPVSPDDGHMITAMHADEDRLYIQKTNGVHYITGSDRGTFELHGLDTEHGGTAFHTMVTAGGRLYWLGWDDFYVSTGGPGVPVSNPKMRRYLDKMDRDLMHLAHATVVPDKELILLTVPLREPVDVPNKYTTTLVFNYKTNAWSVLGTTATCTLNFLSRTFDRFDEPVLWALFTRNLYTYDDPAWNYDEANDTGERPAAPPVIEASWRTKALLSNPGVGLQSRRVSLLGDPVHAVPTPYKGPGTVPCRLRVYIDGNEETFIKERQIDLDGPSDWRPYNLSTLGHPASSLMLELVYNGVPPAEFRSMGWETVSVPRRRRAY